MEFLWNKISSTGCKRSSLNAPGSYTPWCHPLLGSSFFLFDASAASLLPLNHNKEMVYYGRHAKNVEFFWNKISSTGCKRSGLNAPGSYTPFCHPVSSTFGEFPFLPIPNFPPVATRAFAGRRRLRIGRLFLARSRSHPYTNIPGMARQARQPRFVALKYQRTRSGGDSLADSPFPRRCVCDLRALRCAQTWLAIPRILVSGRTHLPQMEV